MKRSFLVGLLLAITSLVALGQEIKTSLRPSIVNGKLHIAVVIENNTTDTVFPAESRFEAVFDTNFADYATLNLVYKNPKWSDNNFYKPMTLQRLSAPSDDVFSLLINPDPSFLDASFPNSSSKLLSGESDTVGVIQMNLKRPCESAKPTYNWAKVVFRKWNVGILAPDRIMTTEQDPNTSTAASFSYDGEIPTTTTVNDSAYVLSVKPTEVIFGWNPIPDAVQYQVQVDINGTVGTWVDININKFIVGGLSDGDKVCLTYRARIPVCKIVQSKPRCVIAFKCDADFDGLRDVTQTYCTSSFKDIIEPEASSLPGSFHFEGAGVNFGAGVWYFDPQQAGAGTHNVTMIGCYGADTVSKPTTVLPAPCSEVLSSSTINLPFTRPQGIFTSCNGDIYFSESDENTIIKIDTFGIGHVIAGVGSGTFGFRDGHIDSALIAFPIGLVVHPVTNELYFADAGNHAVRKYDPITQFVTTIAGGGLNKNLGSGVTGTSGDNDLVLDRIFKKPMGLAFNATFDSLYVSDNENGKVKILALDGSGITTIAGLLPSATTNTQGPALLAQMRGPAQIKYDVVKNYLYIGDNKELTSVRFLDFNSDSIKFLSTPTPGISMVDGHISVATHLKPIDVAPDGQGNLFIMENGFCGLRKLGVDDTVKTLLGTPGVVLGDCRIETPAEALTGDLKLNHPTALSVFINGFVDIVDTDNDRVLRIAIDDFLNGPNKNLDSNYCVSQDVDTINVNSIAGFYTSTPSGYVSDNGTHWVFDPSVGTGNVTVSFHHQVGACQGTEDRTVHVAPLPEFDLGNDTLICETSFGTDSLLVDSTLGAFQWSFRAKDSLAITTLVSDTNYFKVIDSSGTYYLTVTSPFGCIYEDSIVVSQRALAQLQITSTSGAIGIDSVCFDENTVLTVTDNEATSPGFASTIWNNGEVTPSITVDTTGEYIVDVIDVLGCVASDTFQFVKKIRPTVLINVSPNNVAGFKTYVVCPEDTAVLNGGINNGVSYRWFDSTSTGLVWVSNDTLINVIDTGKFYLEVDYADGCTGTDSVEILNYTVPTVNIDTTVQVSGGPSSLTICPSDSIQLLSNPVAVGYTYSWEDLSGNQLSVATSYYASYADNYVLKVTTDNGCEIADTITINHFGGSVSIGGDESICIRDTYIFDAGTGFVSYTWSDNSGGQTLLASDSGMYSVSVVTTDGCTFSDSAYLTVLIPDSVDVLPDTTVIICDLDSTLLTTTLSGTSAGVYSWSDGSIGTTNYVKTAGYHVVTFTDNTTGCTSLDSAFIQVIDRPQFDTLTVDSTICKRDTLPLYVRSVLASDSVFIYGLNTTNSVRTLVASDVYQTTFDGVDTSDIGTYVYVADNGFCTTEFVSNINVTDLQTQITPPFDTVCFGGSILLNQLTTGGRNPYSYSWSRIPFNNGSVTDTTQSTITAYPGNPGMNNKYRLKITDAVGCFAYDTVAYYYNKEINISFSDGVNINVDTVVICSNGTSTEIIPLQAIVSGGTPLLGTKKYNYRWFLDTSKSTTTKLSISQPNSANPGFVALAPIPDTIKVFLEITDLFGCKKIDSVIIKLQVFSINATAQNLITCPGKADTLGFLFTKPGSGSYSYRWYKDISSPDSLSQTDIINPYIKPTISQNILVSVYDSILDCPAYDSVRITVTPIVGNVSTSSIICEGDTALLSGAGSTGTVEYTNTSLWPYSHTYKWSKVNNGEPSLFVNGNDTTEIVQITDGTPGTTTQYQLIVTDSIGCMDTVIANIQWNNTIFSAAGEDTFYVCNNELKRIYANPAFGGVSGSYFDYDWLRLSGNINLPNNGGTTADKIINPLVYFNIFGVSDTSVVELTVTDSIGCFIKDTTVVINNNIEFSLSPTFDTTCANIPNHMIVEFLRDSNSTGNYVFNWNDPADAGDLFQDSLGTIPNTGIRSPYVITDNTQTYELEITDVESGCSVLESAEVVIYNINAIIGLDSWPDDTSIVCFADQIILNSENSSGGTLFDSPALPYNYNWFRSLTSGDASISTTNTDSTMVTLEANGSEGDYGIWVLELTDKAGCVGRDSTTIYWNNELVPVFVDDTVYVCNSDTARLEINTALTTGGSLPYQYSWSKKVTATGGAATLVDVLGTSVRVKSIDNDTTVFSVTMTDSLGCIATKEIVVIGVEYSIEAKSSTPQVCQGIDVSLWVDFTGDIAGGYKYEWSPNIEINDTTIASPTASPTSDRTYTVTVFDSTFKCQATDSVSVSVLDLTAVASNLIGLDSIVMCSGENELIIDGRATFGGTQPYIFSWETFGSTEVNVVGTTSADTIVLTRGIVNPIDTTLLELTVEDFYGCKGIDSVAIYWNSQLAVNIIDTTLYICDDSSKTLQINPVTGGTGSYSYSWSSSDNVQLLSSTNGTSLDVSTVNDDISKVILTVTDELGCQNTDSVTVEGVSFAVSIQAMTSEICQGLEDTLIAVLSGDVTGSYRYTWSPNNEINTTSGNTVVVTPTVNRTYNVVVYDSIYDCKVANSTAIEIVELVAVAGGIKGLDSVFACFGSDTITVNGLNSTFAGSPLSSTGYTYSWSFNSEVMAYSATNNDSLTVVKSSVTPIDTTTLRLTIENEFGCIDSDIVTVYWNSPIAANILEDSIYICSDIAQNLTSSLPSGGTGTQYTYGWSVVSGGAQLLTDTKASSVSVNTVDDDISMVRLNVMDELGCVGFDTVKVQGMNFQVMASAKYDSICAGLSDSLFVDVVNDGIGGYSYLWSPSSDINDATIDNPVVSPTTDSDYMVTVIDSTTGCEAQSTLSIAIYEFNAVAGAAGLDTLMRCFGQTNNIQLNAALTNGGTTPYSYQWSTSDATVNFINNTSTPGVINRTSAGDGSISTIQLLATDNIGCTSTDSIKVLWNSEIVPTVNEDILIGGIVPAVAVCVGVPKEVSTSITGGSGNYSYNWTLLTTPSNVYIVPGTETTSTPSVGSTVLNAQNNLQLLVTDRPVSTSTTCQASSIVRVVAFDIDVTLSVDEDTICPNTVVQLEATTSSTNASSIVYSWDNGSTYAITNTNTISPSTSTITYVYIRDNSTGCINYDSVAIEVSPVVANRPRPLTPGEICYEERFITLAGSASGGKPGGYTYEWRELLSNTVVGTDDTVIVEPPVVAVNDFTNYELVVFDLLGCSDTTTIGVRRYDSIIVDAGLPAHVCIDNTIIVGGSPTGDFATTTGRLDYSWSGGNFSNRLLANPRFNPFSEGLHNLIVEVSIPNTNCSATDTVVVDVKELPIADFSGLSPFICTDSSSTIFANTPDPTYVYPSATTFEWRKVGVLGVLNTNPNADSILVTSGGIYSVLVVDTFMCQNSARIELDSVSSPVVLAHTLDTLGCTNRELVLYIDSLKPLRSGELFGDTIKWSILDGIGYVDEDNADSTFYVPSTMDDFVSIKVEYINQCGIGVDTVSAVIAEAPIAVLDINDSTINITESAIFDASNSISFTGNTLAYRWYFNAPDIEDEVSAGPHEKRYNPEGTYPAELFVYDTQTGCYDSATVNIYVNGTHLLYVPNVFSPNATNPENQTLKMYGFGVSDDDFIFTVYNRWGEKVYEQTSFTQAITVGWTGEYKNSGEQLDMGVYTYIVRARYVDGTPVEKVGTITLLR